MEVAIESLLVRVHDSSGSVLTANSRRLRTLRNHAEALAQCRRDVMEDIKKYASVSLLTKAKCVHRFAQRDAIIMRVCGSCGIRDPFDECDTTVDLNKISADHWLRAKQDAYDRLKHTPTMDLLRPGPDGVYETVSISRKDFHNLFEVGEHAYHAIPEAVIESQCIRLCKHCARGFKHDAVAKRDDCTRNDQYDDFGDLYASIINVLPRTIVP